MKYFMTLFVCLSIVGCDDGAQSAVDVVDDVADSCAALSCPVGFNSRQVINAEAECVEVIDVSASDGPLELSLEAGERSVCIGRGNCELVCETPCTDEQESYFREDAIHCPFPCEPPLVRAWDDGQPICALPVSPDPCEGEDCSGHGRCRTNNGQAMCICEPRYRADGLTCIPDPCFEEDCSGHGACVIVDDAAQCDCEAGYVAVGLECVQVARGTRCDGGNAVPCNGCTAGTWVPEGWTCIPGGEFIMGSDVAGCDGPEPPSACQEVPAHPVSVTQFLMKISEVTNAEYAACVAAGACEPAHVDDCNVRNGASNELTPDFLGPQQPVVCVDWYQVQDYARWVGQRIPGARPPSEAQWEYAARGAGRALYPWGGERPMCDQAVMSQTPEGERCGHDSTASVCQHDGDSPQGVCNLGGNVHEWTADCYHPDYRGAPEDGSAWTVGCADPEFQVTRGGAWNASAGYTRATIRYARDRRDRDSDYGIRLVATASSGQPD